MAYPLHVEIILIQRQIFHVFVPDAPAVKASYEKGDTQFPYWCQVWPAATALSDFLLRHPQYVQDKKVLELAAGLGLPSIVAARYASSVTSSDYLPEAIAVIQQSALHNNLQNLSTCVLNWHCLPGNLTADVILLSDVNYEPGLFNMQQNAIEKFLQNGLTVILSTPHRLTAKDFIKPLLVFCTYLEEIPVPHDEKEVLIFVFVLKGG